MVDDPSMPVPPLSDADRSSLGLLLDDDAVVGRVGRAMRPLELGRIGRYDLLGVVGQGGQGVVYRARESDTRRPVALKRMIAGPFASEAVRSRFRRETEIDLALRHPHIVTVYAVEEVDGQPMLAMEWVDGTPLDRWASADPRPGVADVLRAFLKVCDGVRHAHQRGVIHRDLKPSNILVDSAGEPRVLDFGLAKLMDSGVDPRSRLTHTGGFLGTLAYAAPEQIRGDEDGVDVRTDVYALGCVLHQCLTGRAPFGSSAAGGNVEALSHAICHDDPPRPSSLRPGLDRDLDAIVARAMAKEKTQRYQSVDAFAADMRRFLVGEAIEARHADAAYRVRKFARRHRAGVIAAGLVALSLVGGVVTTGLALLRARAEGARAREEADRAGLVVDLLQQMLTTADPHGHKGRGYTVGQLLDDFDAGLADRLAGKPLVEAEVRVTMGWIYQNLGELDKAERHSRAALDIVERDLPGNDPRRIEVVQQWVRILHDRGRYDEAEALLTPAVAELRRQGDPAQRELVVAIANLADLVSHRDEHGDAEALAREAVTLSGARLGPDHTDSALARFMLAMVLERKGALTEAESLIREMLGAHRERGGPRHALVGKDLLGLARLRRKQGDVAGAEPLLRESLAILRASVGDDHPDLPECTSALAELLADTDRLDEAERLHREALDLRRRARGGDHPDVSESLSGLATVLQHQGEIDAAEPLFREALEMDRRLFGDEHPRVATSLDNLGILLQLKGDLAGAESLHREALAVFRKVLGDEHLDVAIALNNLAHVRFQRGDPAEAETCLRECLAIRRKLLRDDDPVLAQTPYILATVLTSEHRHAEAIPYLRESLDAYRRADPGDAPGQALVLHHLADALRAVGEFDEARTLGAQALAQYDAHPEWGPGERAHALGVLAQTLRDAGRMDEALGVLEEEVEHQRAAAPGSRALAAALAQLGRERLALGRFAQAEPALRECLEIRAAVIPDGDPEAWLRFNTMSMLGESLSRQAAPMLASDPDRARSLLAEAEPLLLGGYEGMKDDPRASRERVRQGIERLVLLYETWARPDEAARYRALLAPAPAGPQP